MGAIIPTLAPAGILLLSTLYLSSNNGSLVKINPIFCFNNG
jgi:hypothetical protein